jgi:N-acetylmuramoyl-L-alanine amidase
MTASKIRALEAPSPNHDARGGQAVDMLVLHYTGMRTGDEALRRLCDPGAKVSAHYMIEEDGCIFRLVPEDRRAWHAGVACWAGRRDINARSIGIELVNPGHEFDYRDFTAQQMDSLVILCTDILARHAIAPERVLGHSDVAPALFGYATDDAPPQEVIAAFQRHFRPSAVTGQADAECAGRLAALLRHLDLSNADA